MNNKIMSLACLGVTFALSICNAAYAGDKAYKAAEIYTKDSMLHGKYVIRMKAAKGSGIISNFFLWKNDSEFSSIFWEEVDFEVFGKDNAQSWQSNIITGLNTRVTSEAIHSNEYSLADDYHTYSLEWTPSYLAWSIDGVEVRRDVGGQVNDLGEASTMRFNFWAPDIPGWVGNFDDAILPVQMFVNWTEYHRWNGTDFELQWRDDFDQFDNVRWTKAEHTFAENLTDFVPENAIVKDGYLVLAMTNAGEEGFNGVVPIDAEQTDDNNGNADGSAEGIDENNTDDSTEGSEDNNDNADGSAEGADDGNADDSAGGSTEGADDGNADGSVEGTDDNNVDDSAEGTDDGNGDADVSTEGSDDSAESTDDASLSCVYTVKNEWNSGFTAEIVLTNTSAESIEGWSVNWDYADGSRPLHVWSTKLSGSGPYTGEALAWNSTISPGQSVRFGLVGKKGFDSLSTVKVTGVHCQ